MIYKFDKHDQNSCLEVELFNEENQTPNLDDNVEFSIIQHDSDSFVSISLSKKDIYRLIGALHLLHKEMK